MATGPEHYRKAEELIDGANALMAELAADPRMDDPALASTAVTPALVLAQVHAMLALAAATALGSRSNAGGSDTSEPTGHAGMWPSDFRAWDQVAGVIDA